VPLLQACLPCPPLLHLFTQLVAAAAEAAALGSTAAPLAAEPATYKVHMAAGEIALHMTRPAKPLLQQQSTGDCSNSLMMVSVLLQLMQPQQKQMGYLPPRQALGQWQALPPQQQQLKQQQQQKPRQRLSRPCKMGNRHWQHHRIALLPWTQLVLLTAATLAMHQMCVHCRQAVTACLQHQAQVMNVVQQQLQPFVWMHQYLSQVMLHVNQQWAVPQLRCSSPAAPQMQHRQQLSWL
jgi:hypothetical protein